MLLKKRLITAAATLAALVVLYAGAAYWMGVKAEETLQEQHKMLTDFPLFTVKSHTYQRGWFSSTETTELVFNRKLIGPYQSMLPEQLKGLLNKSIRYTQHIQHGPLPGLGSFDLRPGRALVTTEFDFSQSTRDTLKKFFGDKEPIAIVNRIGFGGGGDLNVSIPSFDYDEALSGVKMTWKGFTLNVDYTRSFREYQTDAQVPGFTLSAESKGSLSVNGIHFISDTRPGNTGVKVGTSDLTVGDIAVHWKDNIPYNLKLNELVYLMTRVRVGEFINPSGELKLQNVNLRNLHYQIVTSEQDQFVNSRGQLTFDKFTFNDLIYGPMKLDVTASHLHGPTLVKLSDELGKLPIEGVDPAVLRKNYIDTVLKYGTPLLTNDPKFTVNEFTLKMPNGIAKVDGQIGLIGLKPDDLNSGKAFIEHVDASANIDLPRKTLEDLVVAQARNLFMVDASAEEQPDVAEIDNMARQLLGQQLQVLNEQGYIKETNGQIQTSLVLKNSQLTVNKKPVTLPWDEEDEDMDASAPVGESSTPPAERQASAPAQR